MSATKNNVDFMYQTDFEFNNPQTAMTKNSNRSYNRFKSKTLEISPKSLTLKLNNDLVSNNSYRTPRSISKRIKIRSQRHNIITEKPLAKTFINPIIPKYCTFNIKEKQNPKIPEFRVKIKNFQINYMKMSNYPMTANSKLKYSAILDSFRFNF